MIGCCFLLRAGTSAADGSYPIEAEIPQAKQSPYSGRIWTVLKHWPPQGMPESPSNADPLWIAGIKTPGDEAYVGIAKRTWIGAPLSAVAALMDDLESYKGRMPNLKEVRLLAREGNRITTFWRTKAPMFLFPDTKYEQIWVSDDSSAERVVYRHQLKRGNHLKFCDGLIVLESVKDKDMTRLTSFDFFELDMGVLAKVVPQHKLTRKVWKDSLEAYYRGDIALKTQAEHPDWSAGQIEREAERLFKAHPTGPFQFLSPFPFDW